MVHTKFITASLFSVSIPTYITCRWCQYLRKNY